MGNIRGKWKEEDMVLAVSKVKHEEIQIREASDCFAIPKSTLGDRIKALEEGRETVLKSCTANSRTFQRKFTDIHEVELCNHIKTLDSQLMPLNTVSTRQIRWQENTYDFMKRHQNLSLRTAESTSLQRPAGLNKGHVGIFFYKLSDLMEKYSFSPSRIFNADETGVSCVHTNELKGMK
ncbi:hypothetical protein PR048_001275 [Dryococelus australis]|uniref:HTH psq-type domain-containing protein n=1 Tax=Dryococelus australis TaxID=614101 RepID=A0ABQ9IH10_9NEOP|nr:hypothetical protein PR048_001275 [Dryococelus australis]